MGVCGRELNPLRSRTDAFDLQEGCLGGGDFHLGAAGKVGTLDLPERIANAHAATAAFDGFREDEDATD
jgi:hypothetical protein